MQPDSKLWRTGRTSLGETLRLPAILDGQTRAVVDFRRDYPISPPLVSPVDDALDVGLPRPADWVPARGRATQLREAVLTGDALPSEQWQVRIQSLVGRLGGHQVVVAGLGSVGSLLATELVRAGVDNLVLVDPDDVRPENISRSTYLRADVGAGKAKALARQLHAINPVARIVAHSSKVMDVQDIGDVIASSSLVAAVTDDPSAQTLLAASAYQSGVPTVTVGLYRRAAAGEVGIVHPGVGTPCWSCTAGGARGTDLPDKDYGTGRLIAETALGPPIRLVTEVGAALAIGLLAGPDTPAGRHVAQLLAMSKTLGLVATTRPWGFVSELFDDVPGAVAGPQSTWLSTTSQAGCPLCDDGKENALPDDTTVAEQVHQIAAQDVHVQRSADQPDGRMAAPERLMATWRVVRRSLGGLIRRVRR